MREMICPRHGPTKNYNWKPVTWDMRCCEECGSVCSEPPTPEDEEYNALRARIASLESEVERLRGLLREAVSYVRDIVRMTPTGFNRAALDRIEAALARPASEER